MNFIKCIVLTAAVVGFFVGTADAQRRKIVRPKPVVVTSNVSPATELKMGADKVSIQIKNVTKFIFVLGGVASGIEAIDKEAKTKKVAKATLDQNELNKKSVIQAIRNLRAGLAALEVEFRTKNALKKFIPQIGGIADLTARSEDAAFSGKFTASGQPLIMVVEKLSDALAAMP
ncbi:MAG: hypothetical protein WBD22_08245 [Pyrinomonadaceae bacterium]